MNQPGPTIDQNKKQQFKRERNGHGRNHHHTHGQENVGNDQVDRDKGKIEEKADLKGGSQFADAESRDENEQAIFAEVDVVAIAPEGAGGLVEKTLFAWGGVGDEELTNRFGSIFEDVLQGFPIDLREIVFGYPIVGIFDDGTHDVDGQHDGESVQHHVGRNLLNSERVADEAEDDDQFHVGGGHHGEERGHRQQGGQHDQGERIGEIHDGEGSGGWQNANAELAIALHQGSPSEKAAIGFDANGMIRAAEWEHVVVG